MTDACMVLTTSDTEANAKRIVDAVLGAGLVACVQMMPIRSFYVWQGEQRAEPEQLLLIKARTADWDALSSCIRAVHSYDTPEIVRLDIAAGDAAYLAWIAKRGG